MALVLTEEQTMLRDSARAFLRDNAPVAQLRALRDQRDPTGFSAALWQRFAQLGFTGVLAGDDAGGLGLGAVEAGVIMEELGHTLTATPFLSTAVMATQLVSAIGSQQQKTDWLPAFASGSMLGAVAIDETGKHRPSSIMLTATRQGADYRLDGTKIFVLDGHVANLLLVATRGAQDSNGSGTHSSDGAPGAADGGITWFAVDPHAAGVSIDNTPMVDSHNAARIRFDGVVVAGQAMLGTPANGRAALEHMLDTTRSVIASELVGIADECFDRTSRYLAQRQQFGRTIGEFQALQHRAAHLYCEIEVARAVVLQAQQAIASGAARANVLVSAAKAKAGTVATLAVQEAVQMHGGMGVTDEFDLGFFMKRARVLQELLGDANFHGDRIASLRRY